MDEKVAHVAWFSDMKTTIKDVSVDQQLGQMGRSILSGVVGEQSFSLKDADFSRITDVKEILKIALEFQKDTVLFYEMIGSFLEDEAAIAKLGQIFEEENRHIEVLAGFLQGDTAQAPWRNPSCPR